MISDAELEKMSMEDLQRLAIKKPDNLNQIIIILNKKAIEKANIPRIQGIYKIDPKIITKLDLYKMYSVDYQSTKRAIGPKSWFYNFLTAENWHRYEQFIKNKIKNEE